MRPFTAVFLGSGPCGAQGAARVTTRRALVRPAMPDAAAASGAPARQPRPILKARP